MVARIIAWLITKSVFSAKDRTVLLNAVMHTIDAVPIRASITVDENRRVFVHGKPIDLEQLMVLHESASSLLHSQARSLIREQVRYLAVSEGFLKTDDPIRQLFYKAALWYDQEETELIKSMAIQDSTL